MRYHHEKTQALSIEEYLSFVQEGYTDIVISDDKKPALFLELEKKYTSSDIFSIEYAKMLLWGIGNHRDEEKGQSVLKPLIASLHPYALTILGAFLLEKKEIEKALTYIFSAVQLEFAPSFYLYAYCLENELGIKKDRKKAMTYYAMAAKENVALAQYALGNMYQEVNEGTNAIFWWTMASKQKEKKATYAIADAYFNGKGVKKDLEKARTYYKEAFQQGYLLAAKDIGMFLYHHPELDTQYEMALAWLYQLKDEKDNEIHFLLGDIYEKQGKRKDAFSYFLLAAQEKNAASAFKVAEYYEEGKEVECDLEKALTWYETASLLGYEEARAGLRRVKKAIKEKSDIQEKPDNLQKARDFEKQNNIEKANEYYLLAIQEGYPSASLEMEKMHKRLKKEKRCLKCGAKLKGFFKKRCPHCDKK